MTLRPSKGNRSVTQDPPHPCRTGWTLPRTAPDAHLRRDAPFARTARQPPLHRFPADRLRRPHAMCHEMSCFVMRCHVPAAADRPLSGEPSSARLRRSSARLEAHPAYRSSYPRSVPFAPPPACLRRVPVSRVSHVRARPRFAPARSPRAPDCAREANGAGRTSPVRSVGVFSRRHARRETKRPPDAASS